MTIIVVGLICSFIIGISFYVWYTKKKSQLNFLDSVVTILGSATLSYGVIVLVYTLIFFKKSGFL